MTYNDSSSDKDLRKSARMNVMFGAELVSDRVSYAALVRNVSQSGVSVIISPVQNRTDFISEKDLELSFTLPSGEDIRLQCRKRWSNRFLPSRLTRIIGMEVVSPPDSYRTYISTFH